METIFMNNENSKTSERHIFKLEWPKTWPEPIY